MQTKQGDIPLPTFFNLVADAVVHAKELAQKEAKRAAECNVEVTFYVDDDKIGGTKGDQIQQSLNCFYNLLSGWGW